MFGFNPVTKESQLKHNRIKPTQRQMGNISPKVRKKVRDRSKGLCEVRIKCKGSLAVEMAHITGRKQIKHKTTEMDLLDSCVECHRWMDNTVEGIRYRKGLLQLTIEEWKGI